MKKILIVEDDISIAELQRDYLAISGFESVICNNGSEAAELCIKNACDLVILDMMLPGIDGFEVLRILRREMDIPVLIVSARTDEIDKVRGLGLGADDYITKPFSPGELVARVKAHISRYERLKGENGANNMCIIKAGGIEINIDSRRVFLDGTEISLTQKEYELFLHFVRNPDRVFGREELFERIWGVDALGDASTITVHIAKLREKLGSGAAKTQYIETVWGAGYRFHA